MKWVYDDGGRARYYKGTAQDCVCRAISIATGRDYKEVYKLINKYAKEEKTGKEYVSNARTGVHKETVNKLLTDLGWT